MVFQFVWWVVLLAVIPFFFLGTLIHEVSHGLMAMYFGWGIKDLRLWPGSYNGHFYFAWVEFDRKQELEDWKLSLIFIAPRFSNLLFFLLFLLAWSLTPWLWLKTLWMVGYVAQLVDTWVGCVGVYAKERRDHTDIWRFQQYSGWDLLRVRVVTGIWLFFWTTLAVLPL